MNTMCCDPIVTLATSPYFWTRLWIERTGNLITSGSEPKLAVEPIKGTKSGPKTYMYIYQVSYLLSTCFNVKNTVFLPYIKAHNRQIFFLALWHFFDKFVTLQNIRHLQHGNLDSSIISTSTRLPDACITRPTTDLTNSSWFILSKKVLVLGISLLLHNR